MFSRFSRKPFEINDTVFQIVVGSCFGLILGLAFNLFSALQVFAGMISLISAYAILKKPEIALLGILVLTSSVIYEDQLPRLSIGISFHIPDILLLGALGIIGVRWLVESKFKLIRTPLDWSLLFFLIAPIFSTVIAFYRGPVETEFARRALRVFSYYLTFFLVTNLVRERYQLDFLLKGIYVLATIVAVAIVLQFILGSSVQILSGRVETLATQDTMYEGVTRVLPPGWSVVWASFIVILSMLILEETSSLSWLRFIQVGIFGMAMIFTFLRSYWAALLMIFLLMLYLFKGKYRKKLIMVGSIAIFLAASVLAVISMNPDSRSAKLVAATLTRFTTIFEGDTFQGQDSSLNWRRVENGYAIPAIESNLWVGLGLGFTYRPWDPRVDRLDPSSQYYDFRRHIHNGHLWVLLQSGLLGYFSLLWLSAHFLWRGFRNWRHVPDVKLKSVVLGFSLAYLAVFVAAVTNSSFTQWRWTPLLGIMMGINEVILMQLKEEI